MRLAALALACGWGALGYGLYLSPPDHQAWDDLEAGGRFAANFEVYLPYLGLTLPVAGVVLYGLFARLDALSPLWATIVVIAVFSVWVDTHDYLRAAQPELGMSTIYCLVIDMLAAVPLVAASAISTKEPQTSATTDRP